jgi:hypothetical protein
VRPRTRTGAGPTFGTNRSGTVSMGMFGVSGGVAGVVAYRLYHLQAYYCVRWPDAFAGAQRNMQGVLVPDGGVHERPTSAAGDAVPRMVFKVPRPQVPEYDMHSTSALRHLDQVIRADGG